MANNTNNQPRRPVNKAPRFNIFWVYGLIGALIIGWNFIGSKDAPANVDWDQVETMVRKGDVEKIYAIRNEGRIEVELKPNSVKKYTQKEEFKHIPIAGVQFVCEVSSIHTFTDDIRAIQESSGNKVVVKYGDRRNYWTEVLGTILPIALFIGIWLLIMRNMSRNSGGGGGGGIFNVGKAKAQMFDKENSVKTTFKDVAGLEEAKVEIMEIVDFLKKPQKYKDLGGKIPKGALLVGPPGTGKTLLAKAVAGEANVPFFSISGSDFVEMFVGVGASRVRDLFRQAKEKAPCIIFIDEIDAIGRARGKNVGMSSNDERENTLNQLLTEMDGFGTNSGVIILAATNRADILDKALLRAGRFDRQIEVDLPELNDRREIFNVHLKGLKLVKDFDREFLAKQTPGFSGADIANVCNEAALIAARKNKKAVDRDDFLDAIDRIVGGLERKSMVITPEEKRRTAYHEAGHATVSWLLENAHPLIKVTIIPRGRALGAAWYLPDERHMTTREQFMDQMAATMGGRAAEIIHFNVVSTGALSDLEKATKAAQAMVVYYGMSEKIGNVSYYDSTGQNDMGFTKPFSENTAEEIDAEVKKLVDEAMAMAMKVLKDNEKGLIELAELLLDREVIFTEDVERIFGKRKADIEREQREAEAKAAGAGNPDGDRGEDNAHEDASGDAPESDAGKEPPLMTLESELSEREAEETGKE